MSENDDKNLVTKIKEKIEEFKTESAVDIKMSDTDLNENFNKSQLRHKWIERRILFKELRKKKEQTLNKVYSKVYDEYNQGNMFCKSATEIKQHVLANDEYQKHERELEYVNLIIELIDSIAYTLNSQAYEAKSLLEYAKFIQGE